MATYSKPSPGAGAYKSPWLHAHFDKLASLKTNNAGLCLADVDGKGESSLVVADAVGKLRVFSGVRQRSEHPVAHSCEPAALVSFYADERVPRVPAVAVAAGPYVYVYCSLRPFVRFTTPSLDVDAKEKDVWQQAAANDSVTTRALLRALHDDGARLSPRSLACLPMADDQLEEHIERCQTVPFNTQDVVTCLATLKKSLDEPNAQGLLVVGTEAHLCLVLDPTCTGTLARIRLPSTPVSIRCSGVFDVDWRCYVACRDDRVYTLSIGGYRGQCSLRKPHIELETAIVGLVPGDKCIYVATADSSIRCFGAKARKQFTIRTDHPVTNLERFDLRGQREALLILAALSNGDVCFYRGKDLVDVLRIGERISAVACGAYAREVNTLCIVTKAGGLLVKMLPRRHDLATATYGGGPPPEQDIPLDIPKKTQLYLDQTERERELAPEMHRRFQQETVNLQVTTAKAYLELLNRGEIAGQAPPTNEKETETKEEKALVDLRAVVKGLGPFFHLEVEISNLGEESLLQIPILLTYDPSKYKAKKPLIQIGALVPGVPLKCIFELECLDTDAIDQEVEVAVLPSALEDVMRDCDNLEKESAEMFSALLMSRITMPRSGLL